MELLILQFFAPSCYLIHLRSKYAPKHPVLYLFAFPNVKDKVSNLYKTVHRKTKDSELHSPNLVSLNFSSS
jgi:hypothetical protein